MASGEKLPPFHADPDLIGHTEGNKYWLEQFRLAAINANRAAEGLPPLPRKRLIDRLLRRKTAYGG